MEKNDSGSVGRGILFKRRFSTLGCSFYFLGGIMDYGFISNVSDLCDKLKDMFF
jgi:hypothetical protein